MYILPISVDGKFCEVVCDTGSPCTLFPKRIVNPDQRKEIKPCKRDLTSYTGDQIETVGESYANVKYKGTMKSLRIVVTDADSQPLLGRDFLREFKFEKTQVSNINVDNYQILIEKIKNEFE